MKELGDRNLLEIGADIFISDSESSESSDSDD